jgi:hypothetical protein
MPRAELKKFAAPRKVAAPTRPDASPKPLKQPKPRARRPRASWLSAS